MYRKDQLKGIVALVLFACIGIAYFFFDNEDIAKTVSIVCIVLWFIALYVIKQKFKN